MIKRRRKIAIKKFLNGVLKIIILAVLVFGGIKLGMTGKEALDSTDMEVIKRIDAEIFKMSLNYSFPLINMVYNSGYISTSLSDEIKKVVEGIFNFELEHPLTILNSQSSMLYSYYYSSYQPKLLAGEAEGAGEGGTSDSGELRGDAKIKDEVAPEGTTPPQENEDGSPGTDIEEGGESPDKLTTSGKVLVQQPEGTNYKLDIEALLKEPLNIKFDKSGPKALIYHTHTTEAYLKNINEYNSKDTAARTTDERYNVLRVGDEFSKWLKEYGIGTLHNGTNHIEKTDTGAYERSYNTIMNVTNGNPSVKLVFDIHRDASGDAKKLRTLAKVNGKNTAQIMFVVGTNKTLAHPEWKENLKLALKLQKYLEDNYPGITRPIYISKNRYNAQVSKGALIIEVGGDGNTIDEAVESMKYVAKAVSEVIK